MIEMTIRQSAMNVAGEMSVVPMFTLRVLY